MCPLPLPAPLSYPAPPGSWKPANPWTEGESRPPPSAENAEWIRWWNLWVARTCMISCGLGAALALMAGAVTLLLLTDPYFPSWNLPDSGQVFLSAVVMACYFIIAGSFGLGLADRMSRKVPLKCRVRATLLLVIPSALAVFTGGLLGIVPYVRGLLTALPVMGAGLLAWSAGTSPYSGNEPADAGIFRWGLGVNLVVPPVIAALFEVLGGASKAAGIAVVCPALAFLAVLLIAQGLVAYRLARRRWGPVFRRRPDAEIPPAIGTAPAAGLARRPVLGPGALAVLAVVFAMALAPAAAAIASPPGLHITNAEGKYSNGKFSFRIQVVNRGGQEAAGQIEVWLQNATIRVMAGTADRIGGYGLWDFSGELKNSSINSRVSFSAVLVYKGAEQDRMPLRSPDACLTIPMLLPVALAAAAWAGARRIRLRGS